MTPAAIRRRLVGVVIVLFAGVALAYAVRFQVRAESGESLAVLSVVLAGLGFGVWKLIGGDS